jgi:hypothetical protein
VHLYAPYECVGRCNPGLLVLIFRALVGLFHRVGDYESVAPGTTLRDLLLIRGTPHREVLVKLGLVEVVGGGRSFPSSVDPELRLSTVANRVTRLGWAQRRRVSRL